MNEKATVSDSQRIYPFHPILQIKVGAMQTLQMICLLEFITSSKV